MSNVKHVTGKLCLCVAIAILFCPGISTGTIRIMPLGDSITEGLGSTGDVGYRRPLYLGLVSMGYDVDFVGSMTNGLYTDFDRNHEGHYAYYANQIRDNIYNWLALNPADIILLHIGTNDLTDGQSPTGVAAEIGQILDNIDAYGHDHNMNITVVLAQIIDRVPNSMLTNDLNHAIENLYNTRKAAGDNLVLVNMQPALNYSKDMYDAYHPNDNGYYNMAYNWKVAVLGILSAPVQTTTVPSLTGLTKTSAETAIQTAGLAIGTESTAYSSSVAKDLVMSQNPAAGTSVNVGSPVSFVISLGPEPQSATVPNIVGMTQTSAESAISTAGFIIGTESTSYSNTVAKDIVISQSPAGGTTAYAGSQVSFVISLGKPVVPNVIRIMPLGDSITEGFGSTGDVGYRRPLYQGLVGAGYSVDFVGSLTNGTYTDFDRDHEGHYGYYANQIRDNIYNWLALNPADIILLHIGTNDLTDGQSPTGVAAEIGQILDNIDAYGHDHNMNITVVLAQIIDRVPNSMLTNDLNHAIENLYNTRKAAGDNLVLVNMQPALNYSKDMYDAYHPNDNGYYNMAYNWKVAVLGILSAPVQTTTVPSLTGLTKTSAETAIQTAGLAIGTESTAYSDTVAKGLVMNQNPAGGTSVNVGSGVNFTISLGQQPQGVTAPNIVGMTQTSAESAIVVASLAVGAVTTGYSNTVTKDLVMSQDPLAGTNAQTGSSVNFVISLGKPVVPNVVGMTQTAASAAITAIDNLKVGTITQQASTAVAQGLIISQNPVAGTEVNTGSSINLVISIGNAYQQDSSANAIVSIEAEQYSANITLNGRSWVKISSPSGSSGGYAMQALPDTGAAYDYSGYLIYSPRLDFNVNFVKTGTHYIWIRGYATSGGDDSVHAGLDNAATSRSTSDNISGFAYGSWSWTNVTPDSKQGAKFSVPNTGIHTVNIWMREDGFRIDKIVITTNAKYVPTGTGPPLTF